MAAKIFIGTSGWHYRHWFKVFYPPEIKGYYELTFHAKTFNTVENNSSFYRIASENTYKTWYRMTPENYKFSMKLNKLITHNYRLVLNDEVKGKINLILDSTQVLKEKLGAIVIQLPASFRFDLKLLEKFLKFFTKEIQKREYQFDIAIEFRNKYWFVDETYELLEKYNVAIVNAQSSRYPGVRKVTASIAYLRLHGPEKLFSSSYSREQLEDWAQYIRKISKKTKKVYVYFNNDFNGYAIDNAKVLMKLLGEE